MATSRRPVGPVEWVPGQEHWDHWWRYLTPSPVHRRLGLACLAVGTQNGRLPTVGPRILDHYVAVIVLAGAGWFSSGGNEPVDIEAPCLLWLVPGVQHHYGPYEPGWSECFADFTGPAIEAYLELGYIDPDVPVVALTSAEPARVVIRKMVSALNGLGPHHEVEAAASLHELLVVLHRTRAVSRESDVVLAALAHDAWQPWTVLEHARRLNLSLTELRDAVRRGAGCSPKDYLLTVRLNLAKELLATTDLPVSAIARRTGYDDPAYFTRLFTRRVGNCPSAFREQQFRR